MEITPVIATALALGLIIQQVIEAIRSGIDADGKFPKWIWNLAAWGLGVLLAFSASINALESLGVDPTTGQVLSGILMGAGSAFWHRAFSLTKAKEDAAKEEA